MKMVIKSAGATSNQGLHGWFHRNDTSWILQGLVKLITWARMSFIYEVIGAEEGESDGQVPLRSVWCDRSIHL